MAEKKSLKTDEVMALLRKRCSMETGFAMLENVANGVGQKANGRRRFADALAMMQWGRSGHFLHGFEVKISRSDWLRELKDESKADSVYRYCDFWWVVVGDASIVKEGELPAGWGLLAPRGDALVTLVEAARQVDVVVHDRAFVAAIFRRAKEQQVDKALLNAGYQRGYEAGQTSERSSSEFRIKEAQRTLDALNVTVREFEEASGLKITDRWAYGYGTTVADIGRAVRVLLAGERNIEQAEKELRNLRRETQYIINHIDKVLGEEQSATEARVA